MGPSNKAIEGGKPGLHGDSNMENKRELGGNKANQVDVVDGLGMEVRKAVVLDYIEEDIGGRLGQFTGQNPEFVVHSEVDELYPKG